MAIYIKKNVFKSDEENLKKLFENVKQTLDDYMGIFTQNITIMHNNQDYYPLVYFKRGEDGNIIVNLGNYYNEWDRYVYQFAHEYCHIRTNYRIGGIKYSWFEETICEVASHYALKKCLILGKLNLLTKTGNLMLKVF